MVQEQYGILYYPTSDLDERAEGESICRRQLQSLVLIELTLTNRDNRFDVSHFTQEISGQPEDTWQVAYDESFLTMDGGSRLGSEMPQDASELRMTFFIHYWDPTKPLLSSYGEIECPQPTAMPKRLSKLVPYPMLD
jgi:hypothetical protein